MRIWNWLTRTVKNMIARYSFWRSNRTVKLERIQHLLGHLERHNCWATRCWHTNRPGQAARAMRRAAGVARQIRTLRGSL